MMSRAALRLLMAACALVASGAPGRAERLVASLSNHQVMVTSNFTGDELVVFGTVEHDATTIPRRTGYDLVITVVGPRQTVVTFRKERMAGIWVNADSRTFIDAPSYLAILGTRDFESVANPEALRRLQVGLAHFQLPQKVGPDLGDVVPNDPFRLALLRLKSEHGLYREEPNAVTFLTPNLYRAAIPLPAEAPFGTYEVDVKLFADGVMIARTNSAFEIVKVGFEQFVANAAREHGLIYGLATGLMALFTGWFASVVFRRD